MRKLCLFIITILALPHLAAAPEFWLGGSFLADRNLVSSDLSSSFPAMGEDISQIRSIGLSVDAAFFPWNAVRIGIVLSSHTLLPIGVTERGGSNEGYITYDFDFREDLAAGIGYYQFFTDKIGMLLSASFYYTWYKTAMEHIANESAPMEYMEANEYGINAEAGIISRSDNMYFRLGISFSYDLSHLDNMGIKLALFAGGGFIIG